jgi:hypothetical protein
LRSSFFQAVSNSSWASEGYLVALEVDPDGDFQDELRRLNSAFGIGIIHLNPNQVDQSEIIFPSRIETTIDWNMVNKLAEKNRQFRSFLKSVTEDIGLERVKNDSEYDVFLSEEKLRKHVEEKGIIGKTSVRLAGRGG